mmetsp:Transcript_145553/g.271007  ORF Transcript_145553/g.271007 Transcript_145553/m.271007 type:complete len:84 (+) Transcript_145553:50-301(+)
MVQNCGFAMMVWCVVHIIGASTWQMSVQVRSRCSSSGHVIMARMQHDREVKILSLEKLCDDSGTLVHRHETQLSRGAAGGGFA